MKIQTTVLLLGLLLVAAQGKSFLYWGGHWDLTPVSSNGCYPDRTITIDQTPSQLTVSWVWAKTQPCETGKVAGETFTKTVPVPDGKSISLQFTVGTLLVSGTFTITDSNVASFNSDTGAHAICQKRKEAVYLPGTWDIVSQDNNLCNPDKFITVTAFNSTHVKGEWTWDNSLACQAGKVAGKKFSEALPFEENNVLVALQDGDELVVGFFTVVNEKALFYSLFGGSASFTRRQESVSWVGTWNIDSKQAGTGCFPDTSIVITEEKGSITAKWTWAKSDFCGGLGGQEFTHTEPTPKGRSIYLGLIVENKIISGIFTIDGNQAHFASNTGANANFSRKSGSMGIIIVILLIVVVAAGGFFYMRSKGRKVQSELNSSLAGIYRA